MTRHSSDVEISAPADDAECRAFADIANQAFFASGVDRDSWIEREGRRNLRLARRQGKLAGGLAIQNMGMWLCGRSVPMAGVRVVAIAPEHRATGVASGLMRAALEEAHREGVPLSALYPATQPVYRRVGYEQAGVRLQYRLPTQLIDTRDRSLDVHPIHMADWPKVKEAYTERARRTAGNLDRSEWMWRRILDPPPWGKPTHGYLAMRGGQAEGYVVFSQKGGDHTLENNELELVDFVALTADAGRRLLTFVGDHRSTAVYATWYGAPADPLLYLLTEQPCKVSHRIDWMLRLIDVPAALEARGYAPGQSAELHLEVRDDVLEHNNRRFVLQVADSQAAVEEGGRGDLSIDVRGLAAVYTGRLTPTELKATGYVEGSERVLRAAEAVFSGPAPWMPDLF